MRLAMRVAELPRLVVAVALVGWLTGAVTLVVVDAAGPAGSDWCYNDCGSEAPCDRECEADGGGVTTCGAYDGGAANGWCDGDTCAFLCSTWSPAWWPCWFENEPADCGTYGVAAACGDGTCQNSEAGEGCDTCQVDCGNCPIIVCGDHVCDAGETYVTCPEDCDDPGPWGWCGDGICSAEANESPETCFIDCAMPRERCDDEFTCGAGYTCVRGGQPKGGQCVYTEIISALARCPTGECGHLGAGYVCRQANDPWEGTIPVCVYWWDLH